MSCCMKGNGIPITKGWTLRNEFVCPLITLESPAFRRGECQKKLRNSEIAQEVKRLKGY